MEGNGHGAEVLQINGCLVEAGHAPDLARLVTAV